MLILTRRPQETIRVGPDVTITVLGVEGGKVRIGITAPRHITVDRQEVYERKQREGRPDSPEGGSS
jgi:carbon storage regulator